MGGAEIHTLSLMEGLRARDHDVTFLGSCPILLAECRKRNFPTTELHIGPPPVTLWHAISFWWRQFSMRRTLRKAISLHANPTILCMLSLSEKLLIAPSTNTKIVWIEHDRVGRWLRQNPWLGRLRRMSRFVTTVTVSELSRKLYLALGWHEKDIVAIPNGIDGKEFEESVIRDQESEGKKLQIGCVARLTKDKGVDLLIEAMKEIPNAQLSIVGQGREESVLQSLIASEKLSDRVAIKSGAEDIRTFYRTLDVLVLPSRDHDPFGLVAAEAMSMGVPVIVTDQCGIADYVTDGSDAIVVSSNSSQALIEGLHRLSKSEERTRIGAEGRLTAHERFSLDRMIDRYEKMLEKVSAKS